MEGPLPATLLMVSKVMAFALIDFNVINSVKIQDKGCNPVANNRCPIIVLLTILRIDLFRLTDTLKGTCFYRF